MKFVVVSPGEVLLEVLNNVFWYGHSCYVRGHWGSMKQMEEKGGFKNGREKILK